MRIQRAFELIQRTIKLGFFVYAGWEDVPDSDEFTAKLADIEKQEDELIKNQSMERIRFYYVSGFKDYIETEKKIPSREMISERAKNNEFFRTSLITLDKNQRSAANELRQAKEKIIRLEQDRKLKSWEDRFAGLSSEQEREKRRLESNDAARRRYLREDIRFDRKRRNRLNYERNATVRLDRMGNPILDESGEAASGIKEVQRARYQGDEAVRRTQIERVKENQRKKKEADPHYQARLNAEAVEKRRWNRLTDEQRQACPCGCKGDDRVHRANFRANWQPPKESSFLRWGNFKVIKVLDYEKYYNGDPIELCYS